MIVSVKRDSVRAWPLMAAVELIARCPVRVPAMELLRPAPSKASVHLERHPHNVNRGRLEVPGSDDDPM